MPENRAGTKRAKANVAAMRDGANWVRVCVTDTATFYAAQEWPAETQDFDPADVQTLADEISHAAAQP